jgi:hypothetical protein
VCGGPFSPSFDEATNIQGWHATAGLLLHYDIDQGHCQITAMQPGTPANPIHTWKSRLCGAYILRINTHDVMSILDVTHADRDARLSRDSHITVTLTFEDKIVNTLNHAGLPQLCLDQMWDIQNHLHKLQQPQINKASVSGIPNLARRKLQQSAAWPEWLAAEHIQLDNHYHAQGMFGTPTVLPPNLSIFYWVWVYKIKEMEDNRIERMPVPSVMTLPAVVPLTSPATLLLPHLAWLICIYKSLLLLNMDLHCTTLMSPTHLPKPHVASKCTTCVLMHHFVNGGVLIFLRTSSYQDKPFPFWRTFYDIPKHPHINGPSISIKSLSRKSHCHPLLIRLVSTVVLFMVNPLFSCAKLMTSLLSAHMLAFTIMFVIFLMKS